MYMCFEVIAGDDGRGQMVCGGGGAVYAEANGFARWLELDLSGWLVSRIFAALQ